MRAPSPRNATLVVIEYGASWPRWLPPTDSGDLAVVAQHYEGESGSLVRQVASRVTRLEAGGWRLFTMVLVTTDASREVAAERSVLARGLIAHLGASGGGELSLTAEPGTRAAHALTALAAALAADARAARVTLAVRIGFDSARPSAAAPPTT